MDDFVQAVKALVEIEKDWVPRADGTSLYIRPFAVQPQHLGKALPLRQLAGLDGRGVVAAALGEARQARGGPDVLVLHVDAHRVNAL